MLKATQNKIIFFLLVGLIIHPSYLQSTSIVYNFRIAQITKQPIATTPNRFKNSFGELIFNIYQKKYDHSRQLFSGTLSSYIRSFEPYYFRIDFAFAHLANQINHVKTFSGNRTDDLLFSAGRNFKINEQNTISLSGLFGVPTHKLELLLQPEFGYAQVGLGLQLDGTYNFNKNSALIYGTRYIYFVPSTTQDEDHLEYKFTAGQLFDLLLAGKYDHDKHGFEGGYTTKFQLGTKLTPTILGLEKQNYISNNFYLVYKYRFLIQDKPSRLLFNIAYGFNHKEQPFANKSVITSWASWNISF